MLLRLGHPHAVWLYHGGNRRRPERLICRLRGRLKQNRFEGDIVAIGDRVNIILLPDGSGMIEEIEPRTHELARMAPTPRGEYRQILLANPDQVVLVFACAQPEPTPAHARPFSGDL